MTWLTNEQGIGSAAVAPWDQMPSIEPNDPGLNYSTVRTERLQKLKVILMYNLQPSYLSLDAINGDDKQVWLSQQAISRGVKTIYADAWSADCKSILPANLSKGALTLCRQTT